MFMYQFARRQRDKAAAELEEVNDEIARWYAKATEPQDVAILEKTVFMQVLRMRQQLARLKINLFSGLVDKEG